MPWSLRLFATERSLVGATSNSAQHARDNIDARRRVEKLRRLLSAKGRLRLLKPAAKPAPGVEAFRLIGCTLVKHGLRDAQQPCHANGRDSGRSGHELVARCNLSLCRCFGDANDLEESSSRQLQNRREVLQETSFNAGSFNFHEVQGPGFADFADE